MATKKSNDLTETIRLAHERTTKVFDVLSTQMEKMNGHLASIDTTLTGQAITLSNQSEQLKYQAEELKEHIRRTDQNEILIEAAKAKQASDMSLVHKDIDPLKAHVAMWAGAWKVLAGVAAIGTILGGIAKFIWH